MWYDEILKVWVKIHGLRVQMHDFKFTSSNSRIASLNSWVTG